MQDPQVLRDRLPRDVEVRGDPSRGHLVVADEMQDLASSGLGDGIDGCLHVNVSIYYRNLTLAQVCAYNWLLQHQSKGAGMRARTSIAIVALAASCLLTSGVGTAAAQSPTVCQWGGTQPNPTGQITINPGLTNTPSPFALAFKAWGPVSGGGPCHGQTVTYVGQINAGSSCASVTGFEQIVYGLPGVKYAWGPGVGPFVHELLYDANGNLVGEDTPIAFPPDANDPAYQDCGTSEGLTHNRFSSTITLFGGV